MTKNIVQKVSITLVLFMFGYLAGLTSTRYSFAANKKVEYKVIERAVLVPEATEAGLNKMGDEGWELIGWGIPAALSGSNRYVAVFKR